MVKFYIGTHVRKYTDTNKIPHHMLNSPTSATYCTLVTILFGLITQQDLFLWSHMKNLIYETPVVQKKDLLAHIIAAAVIGQFRYW